jgi:type II secretory pathway component PulJ
MPSGFTLIELLGYLVLSLLLITLTGSLGIAFYSSALKRTRTIDHALEMIVALHCMARDLKGNDTIEFKEQRDQVCIIRKNGVDIGWIFTKGMLLRCVGQYEKASSEWKSSAKSLLATGLQRVKFNYHTKSVKCYLESGSISLEQYIGVP